MRITHVVPHIDQEASGPSYSVPRLCQSVADCGNVVELKCLAANGPVDGIEVSAHRQWPGFGRFAISTDLARSLRAQARNIDIIHNHSLWSMVNVAAGCVVPGHRAKLVTSPRGTLSAWALGRRKYVKQLMWPLQRRVLSKADLIHATSEAEYRDIRMLGLRAPVVIIPNGIDLPPAPQAERRSDTRTLLYLGRIHPIKGIDNLLHAWHTLENRHPDWRLVIAGRGEPEHVASVKQLATSLGVGRVEFPGAVYGNAKTTAYHDADLFVLPTHSENFGMVVAEALAHACPAIVTHGAPWPGLETEGCGWWITDDRLALVQTLDTAMATAPERLHEMGMRGRAWMARDYSWQAIGELMSAAYRWLLEGGHPPPHIRLD
jgi:glycosyltransferase involved in cell wall biosynthesis